MSSDNVNFYPNLNAEEEPDLEPTEISSLCMNCQEDGITRLLLTKIPFYKEVIIMSFSCEHCGFQNNEMQSGGEISPQGMKIVATLQEPRDLNRRVIKSDFCSVRIDEIDFEIPMQSQKGEVTTVEGIINRAIEGLEQDQPVRRIQHPEAGQQIDKFIKSLNKLKDFEKPFTLIIEDITGNCFVENYNAPKEDPNVKITHFFRNMEQNHLLGMFTKEEIDDVGEEEDEKKEESDHLLKPIAEGEWPLEELHGEVLHFPTPCPECKVMCETNMKMTTIPHFKEVVIMATSCENCGHRTNEVKSGSGIEEKGVKMEVSVRGREDFSRDVLKSEYCDVMIKELDCHVGCGVLGGRFTTIEGLLTAMKDQILESCGMFGDSSDNETGKKMDDFILKLDEAIKGNRKLTVVLDDPTGNSYVQSLNDDGTPDEYLKISRYDRSFDQNEELGLNDMKTENYS